MVLGREIFEDLKTTKCRLAHIAEFSTVPIDKFPGISARASPRRLREYTAGRALAAGVLEALGYTDVRIEADKDRCPVWPDELVGSISHTDTMVAVAVSLRNFSDGIGIDIERMGAVSDEFVSSILTETELKRVGRVMAFDYATLIFACKEAFYKAVFPSLREALDFHDAQVWLEGDRFSIECGAPFQSARLAERGEGNVEFLDNHVLAVYRIPAQDDH